MAASRALNDQFRMLFEGAPNGVMAVDAAGCIIQLNAQIEKMFGYSREELIGRPAEVLFQCAFGKGTLVCERNSLPLPRCVPWERAAICLAREKTKANSPLRLVSIPWPRAWETFS